MRTRPGYARGKYGAVQSALARAACFTGGAIDKFREHGAEGPGFEISREQAAEGRLTSTRAHRAGDCAVGKLEALPEDNSDST